VPNVSLEEVAAAPYHVFDARRLPRGDRGIGATPGSRGLVPHREREMDIDLRDTFTRLWGEHFGAAGLPIGLYYSDDETCRRHLPSGEGHVCLIGQLARVRKGDTLAVDRDSPGCGGGKRYLGLSTAAMPDFEYFLSCGIPGKLAGERYKKSPEIVREAMAKIGQFHAPAKYAVFKRWDKLDEADGCDVVIFFADADVLAGLYTLSNFDRTDPNAVIAPFGAGCATIAQYPYLEGRSESPRSVLGMFDVSARPFVGGSTLSFAVPMSRFAQIVANTNESFLITDSWAKVRKRIASRRTGE